jgi:hypothetical protein
MVFFYKVIVPNRTSLIRSYLGPNGQDAYKFMPSRGIWDIQHTNLKLHYPAYLGAARSQVCFGSTMPTQYSAETEIYGPIQTKGR